MNTANYKSTIGGAFSAVGTMLMGIGIVPQLGGVPSKMLTGVAMAGFVCNAIGAFLGHLFSADAKSVADLTEQVKLNSQAIKTGDSTILDKTPEPPKTP